MAWGDIGASNQQSSTTSDLVSLEGQKRLRLLLPPEGPVSHWFYTISTPAGEYRTWKSPDQAEDFFAKNRRIFRVRPTHAGLAWDYDEGAIKILESGNQIWEQIKDLVDAGKDLSGRDILITKKGTGRNTEYKVVDLDPSVLDVNIDSMQKPDMEARYIAPSHDEVMEDLKQMGFTNPDEIFQTQPIDIEEAKAMEVPFGKHKGSTLNDIYTTDSQYLLFLSTKIDREDIKQCARVVANHLMGTQYEVDGLAPDMDEVTFVAPNRDEQANATNTNDATPPAPPVAPTQEPMQRPSNPQFIHSNPDGSELWWDGKEWVEPPVAPTPPAPPVPTAPVAPTAPPVANPATTNNRQELIDQINQKFEQDPQYKDFMRIIAIMKEATAPNEKTAINDFTDEEVQKLADLVLK